ncbi:FAD-dependent oxidoreductase [Saccharopolyspora dendranthemae]|uniref:Pyruvate/2-oxoglutarate dehydrogenase complex dihydrolipoamide dehydrogenase (E3) component n=1 Tax=Saccharopolyspora dendranthemae TaxID=1181886 RepID=A0A561U713_9PSEU|nr:FAD-dependent oxidoreductase [Saccharopolyspora dendranthemae]TWF95158.1 pyruvate/2-oxoglutarate dehydrogenase complex dihydrolipoamide dehydrogenase (E3) component [Saccharopolyspora dendranthemae]
MSVVVVGAGPAGMAAARHAARAGADVLLVDSSGDLGGRYHQIPPAQFGVTRPQRSGSGQRDVEALADEIRADPRIRHFAGSVRSIDGHTLHVRSRGGDAEESLHAEAVVLATGAHDRVLPFPGWELPGVFTAGGAHALARGQRVAVGSRVVVAGTGPFLLPVAESLLDVGAEVVAVLDAGSTTSWLRRAPTLAGQWDKLAGFAGYLRRLVGATRFRTRAGVVEAIGDERVREAVVAKLDARWRPIPGTHRRIPVDAICVAHGFEPRLELARAAGCDIVDGFVRVDDEQRSSTPWVFAAGETTGIAGARAAAAEGAVAGLAAAVQVRATTWRAVEKPARRARLMVRCGQRFGRAMASATRIGEGWNEWLTPQTVVCRCEEVPYQALRDNAPVQRDASALNRSCRVGLGSCQGRMCGRSADELAENLLRPPANEPPLA